MSRIGKLPILIPQGVEVKIEGQKVKISGPKGELFREVLPEIKVISKEGEIILSPKMETKTTKAFWGLERALLQNMVTGVSQGFEKKLEIQGVGYKSRIEGENLVLEVGFSHLVKVPSSKEIKLSAEGNIITVSGIDNEKVGQIAAKIRKIRPPDRYKGKGIRYLGEEIKLKPGKKTVATTG